MNISRENLFVSIVDNKLRHKISDININFNFEVPLFCLPDILDGAWQDYVKKIKSVLGPKGLTCGMHGPFYNLAYHSRDPMVREVAEKRMRQGLRIASALDARFIVFHSTYSQFVAIKDYYMRWPSDAMQGLPEIVKEAQDRNILMVIENIWDDVPLALKYLIDKVQSDFLKICIDVGHLNIFSKVPLKEWFETLWENIAHFHIHNNFGTFDSHNALNDGAFDFEKLFSLISKYNIDATYTIEVEKLESVEPSIIYLEKLGILESDPIYK